MPSALERSSSRLDRSSLAAPDALAALVTSAAFFALYARTFQSVLFGDGPGLLATFASSEPWTAAWIHALYFPAADAIRAALGTPEPLRALELASSLPGALGVGATFLLCRALGAERGRALLASACTGLAPAWWFFATTVEVHALHGLAAAGGAALVAGIPAARARIAAAAGTVPLLYGTHLSAPLLAPGWILLARGPRARSLVAPAAAVGAAFALCMLALGRLDRSERMSVGEILAFIDRFHLAPSLAMARDGWALPLGALLALAAVALASGAIRGRLLAILAALLAPSIAFFLWYGEANAGGYFVGTAPFLAVAASRVPAPPPRVAAPLAVAILAGQSWLGIEAVTRAEGVLGDEHERRVAAVERELGGDALLFSFDPSDQRIERSLPGVSEKNLAAFVAHRIRAGASPSELASRIVGAIREAMAADPRPAALDLGYRRYAAMGGPELECALLVEEALRADPSARVVDGGPWPLLVLRGRDS